MNSKLLKILWGFILVMCILFFIKILIIKTERAEKIEETPQIIIETEATDFEFSQTIAETEVIEDYFYLTDEEYTELCNVVMAEAGGECYEGQMAVAQCILNACFRSDIRPKEVYARYGYTPNRKEASDSVKKAVDAVFKNGEIVTTEPILYFYAPRYCTSDWHESQKFVMAIGNHRFFALK